MLDFMVVSTRSTKRGTIEIYPKFLIKKSTDLMIRGGDFYAIWIEERGLWSTDEQDALQLIDRELDRYAEENRQRFNSDIKVLHMWDAESGMIDSWHKYCQKQLRDSFHTLDNKLIFSNTETTKKDYASKRLNYPLEEGDITAYEKLISTLYSPEERMKIEWAIGSIVCGESQKLQKFLVLYGAAGTGKSTILNIIQQLFEGYYSVFDAKALGSSSNSFALEAFKSNPLVAIQHDGDLSRIEDNTKVVGQIRLGSSVLDVYGDLDEPLFKAADIANIIEYSYGNTWRMLDMCEADEKLNLPMVVAGQRRSVSFVNEHGLYSILSQSRKEIARAWRRVVHDELINLRRTKGFDISEQFDEWNNAMDNIYFDEATGQLMQSVTTPGGDVEQIPYK